MLLAEDGEEDQVFFKFALKKIAPDVALRCVHDGHEAMAWLEAKRSHTNRMEHPFPDIIVTDLKMPRSNAFDLLEWLRCHREYRTTPKIVLSSSFLQEDVVRAYELGANAFFDKPSEPARLEAVLRTMLAFWNLSLRPSAI